MDVKKWFMYSVVVLFGVLLFSVISIGIINNVRMEAAIKEERPEAVKNFKIIDFTKKQDSDFRPTSPSITVVDKPILTAMPSPNNEPKKLGIKPVSKTSEGVPVFTNDSFPEKKKSTGDWNVYRQLRDTCNTWTNRFKKDGSERNRVNMNQSCRYAADYAKNQLHINPGPVNHASYKTKPRNQSGGAVTGNSVPVNNSQCDAWEREKERVQNQLRAGYREPRGNWLRERKRTLSELIYKNC